MKRVIVVLMAVLLLAACSESSPRSSGDNAPDSPVSGVAKDSPADVNSTKDMTGVVMEYPPGKNPYFNRMPDVCKFIPDSLMKELGMIRKKTGFDGSSELFQSCNMYGVPQENGAQLSISAGLYAQNISSSTDPSRNQIVNSKVDLGRNVIGTVYISPKTNVELLQNCFLDWGTFYGTASVNVGSARQAVADPCDGIVEIAKKILPYLPSKPYQLRL
ncbi:hypothetical protein [Williamsia sp. CHRR-6]|uniref:hypothetical protein n=1 Tax=Williamsia sp. CHRR-6 TaxID=2835871 RepID=UPI001BD98826|nr:hypothetical protein [Williamsia sp. CHRR-6]MBT0568488.1 hypothetical protein [Williamsia sp. CHRR-6]